MPIFEDGMTDGARSDKFASYMADTYTEYIKAYDKKDEFNIPSNDPALQEILKVYPTDVADSMIKNAVVRAISQVKSGGDYSKKYNLFEEYKSIKIGIECDILLTMHEITPEYEGKRVKFNGIINGLSEKKTYYIVAEFKCRRCGELTTEYPDDLFMTKIPRCDGCKLDMVLDKSRSITQSIRRVILEEPVEESINSNPQRYTGILVGKEVHSVAVGQRKKVTGIFRSVVKDAKNKLIGENDILIIIEKIEDMSERREVFPTAEEIDTYKFLALQPDYIDKLVGSFTNKIGLYYEKLAILLSLVKGSSTEVVKRDDIHILLEGNPSVAKSELLQFAHLITPKSYSTSGENLSKVGLRGGIEQTDGYPIFVAGTLSMANGSHLCIDELDKIVKDDLGALMTSMEQQYIEYDKIIHMKSPADTSILAAANPKRGYYDEDLTLQQNFDLPFTLQTRFDLIFLIKSTTDEDSISKIAKQATKADYKFEPFLSKEKLSAYLNYCRTLKPKFTDEAGVAINDFWVRAKMTSLKLKNGEGIKIEPRHLHGLIRLSFAFAKLQLHETVTIQDAISAINIFKTSLMSLGQDVETGEAKQGTLTKSPKEKKDETWFRVINELAKKNENGIIEPSDLVAELVASGNFDQFNALDRIRKEELKSIITNHLGKYKLT